MKLVIKVFNIILIFTFLTLPLACSNSSHKEIANSSDNCVKTIIAIDDSLGKIRNHQCEEISLSETIKNYTASLRSLDYSQCPQSFSNAFMSHIDAWNNVIEVTDKYSDLRGEMHELFDQIKQTSDSTQFKSLVAEIWNTWADIEKEIPKE